MFPNPEERIAFVSITGLAVTSPFDQLESNDIF